MALLQSLTVAAMNLFNRFRHYLFTEFTKLIWIAIVTLFAVLIAGVDCLRVWYRIFRDMYSVWNQIERMVSFSFYPLFCRNSLGIRQMAYGGRYHQREGLDWPCRTPRQRLGRLKLRICTRNQESELRLCYRRLGQHPLPHQVVYLQPWDSSIKTS